MLVRLRLIHVFVLALLVLELVAYFSFAYQNQGSDRERAVDAPPSSVAETHEHNVAHRLPPASRSGDDDSCITHPNQTQCTNYQLPTPDVYVKELCGMMPHMAACSVNNLCLSHGGRLSPGVYCEQFSILKDICTTDMSTMTGCHNYTSMCGPSDSVVKECAMQSLPLPSDSQLSQWITQICTEMPMDGCKQCNLNRAQVTGRAGTLNCDLLVVYSHLCLVMPDMQQCSGWSQLCELIPSWPICPGTSGDEQPIMRMYFHTGLVDYVLFKQWVPRNWWEYGGTFLAIIVMGILYEGLKTARGIAEDTWAADRKRKEEQAEQEGDLHHHTGNGQVQDEEEEEAVAVMGAPRARLGGWTVQWVPFDWRVDLPRALFVFVEIGVGLVLMLIAMTFNVGLFFAVCLGGFCGSLIFGRFSATYTKSLCH